MIDADVLKPKIEEMRNHWNENRNDWASGMHTAFDISVGMIDEAFSIKIGEWIPDYKRRPREQDYVLVTTDFGEITTCIYYKDSEFWKLHVIAWMPLPEPYKEDEDESDSV